MQILQRLEQIMTLDVLAFKVYMKLWLENMSCLKKSKWIMRTCHVFVTKMQILHRKITWYCYSWVLELIKFSKWVQYFLWAIKVQLQSHVNSSPEKIENKNKFKLVVFLKKKWDCRDKSLYFMYLNHLGTHEVILQNWTYSKDIIVFCE